jgi:hypothetical protein
VMCVIVSASTGRRGKRSDGALKRFKYSSASLLAGQRSSERIHEGGDVLGHGAAFWGTISLSACISAAASGRARLSSGKVPHPETSEGATEGEVTHWLFVA